MMVMKAMSLQLIRGVIDEVEEKAHIDWIMPRYLNQGHLQIMISKMNDWDSKMKTLIDQCLIH
jgi:26S proteasome regulatory subunit N9